MVHSLGECVSTLVCPLHFEDRFARFSGACGGCLAHCFHAAHWVRLKAPVEFHPVRHSRILHSCFQILREIQSRPGRPWFQCTPS